MVVRPLVAEEDTGELTEVLAGQRRDDGAGFRDPMYPSGLPRRDGLGLKAVSGLVEA